MGDSPSTSPRTASLIHHMTRMLEAQANLFNDKVNELREEFVHQREVTSPRGTLSTIGEYDDESERDEGYERHRHRRRHRGHGRRHRDHSGDGRRHRRHDDKYESGKIKFPSFHGKSDPDAYLDWELKMDQLFEVHEIHEDRRVKLASLEFKDYALLWWDQNVKDRRRCGAREVDDWEDLKRILRQRYVPSLHHRDLHQKLQKLKQGSKSVEDYYIDFETLRIRSNTREDEEAKIARFLNGLSYEIRDVVELQRFQDIEELVHQASKVEQQLKRKSNYKKYSSSKDKDVSHLKDKHKREGSKSPQGLYFKGGR